MSRFLKWTIIAGGSLAAALVLAVVLLPSMIEVERYRPLIERELSRAAGRPVRLSGELSLSIFPWIGVETGPVSVDNPEGFGEPRLISVEAAEIRVAALPLLRRAVEVKRFVLRSPEIALERTAEGRANWENLGPAETAPESESPGAPEADAPEPGGAESPPAPDDFGGGKAISDLAVDELAITGGKLVWIDAAAGERREVTGLDLRVENLSFDQAISLAVSAQLDGRPVAANGEVGPLGNPPGSGTIPFSLAVQALDEIEAEISGEVANPTAAPSANLSISVSPFSPRNVFERLSLDFPVSTADPEALNRVALSGQFQGGPESFTLSGGVLELDGARIDFSANLKSRAPLQLAAGLEADALDVVRYLPPESAGGPAAGESPGKTPSKTDSAPAPDLSALEAAVLDLSFTAGRLTLPELTLTDAGFQLSGEKGRFDLDLSAKRDGRPLALRGTVGPATAQRIDLDLTANVLDQVQAAVAGAVLTPAAGPVLDASISVAPFAPRMLAEAAGLPFPVQTADPAALGRLGFSGNVRGGAKSLRVENGVLTLDETTARFQMNAAAFSPPNVAFDLGLDRINLDRYLPPSENAGAESPREESAKKPESGPAAPGGPIDYGPLRRMRIDGAFRAESLTVRGLNLAGIRLKIFGEEGIFRLDPLNVNLYRGSMSITGQTDATGPEPLSRADLSVRGVALGPLLADAAQSDLAAGSLNASAKLSARGGRPETIVRSLDGTVDLRLSDGRIKGLNLVNMARNLEAAFQNAEARDAGQAELGTEFTALDLAATLEDGRATLTEGRMTSPVMEADAGGSLHLAERTLDLRVTPTFIQPVGGRNAVAVPVVIDGTFDRPRYRPDLANLIRIDPKKTVDAILADPEKGVKDLLNEQKDRIRSILLPGREGKEAPADPARETAPSGSSGTGEDSADEGEEAPQEKREPSAEDAVRNLLRSLPFGN